MVLAIGHCFTDLHVAIAEPGNGLVAHGFPLNHLDNPNKDQAMVAASNVQEVLGISPSILRHLNESSAPTFREYGESLHLMALSKEILNCEAYSNCMSALSVPCSCFRVSEV